jgi:hypothetical protein
MRDDTQGRHRNRKRLWLVLAAVAALLAALIGPPLVSIGRYKGQITRLMSASLGRPVHLSSVSLRLLPWPGFEFSDLVVDEDSAYGAEPVLHANSVTASFRLLALWRGQLQISSISMDEASLNLVRSSEGKWNLDPIFRTATSAGGNGSRHPLHLPYLEAKNSRINVKDGDEKLPFSLLNTDVSLWQESSGEWRIRLRGDPVRTDLSQEGTDTGTLRLEASVRPAPGLRQMPVHVDLEWRQAQLGQLTRLMIGSDPGWRGDLTAELHLDGTADAAQMTARLRATGVHREEFAPAEALDFDARCALIYHYSERSMEKLTCDSPLGDGAVHLAGDLPRDAAPQLTVELNQIPAQAVLDALRTVRSGIAPGLAAKGRISGKITYAVTAADPAKPRPAAKISASKAAAAKPPVAPGPLSGTLTVDGLALSGDGLSQPIMVPKLTLQPVMPVRGKQSVQAEPAALTATLAIPLGAPQPMNVAARLTLDSYKVALHGQASLARARELVHVAGMAGSAELDALAGDPIAVDLTAEGPWLSAERNPFAAPPIPPSPAPANPAPAIATAQEQEPPPTDDSISGTITLHNANWKADYLTNHVMIAQAVLHLARNGATGTLRWDPIAFAYGPVKGTATLTQPIGCAAPDPCLPQFQIQLGSVEADALQEAFLGARQRGTLLSTLLDRLRSTSAPVWPRMQGTVNADALVLGPVTLHAATAALDVDPASVEITSLTADLLGGQLSSSGTVSLPQSDTDKPAYSLDAQCAKLSPSAVGALVGQKWTGSALDVAGKLELSGYAGKDLASSAKGSLHFEWKHGGLSGPSAPPDLARFDAWSGDAAIANGAITLGANQAQQAARKHAVQGAVPLDLPAKFVFAQPVTKSPTAKKAPGSQPAPPKKAPSTQPVK